VNLLKYRGDPAVWKVPISFINERVNLENSKVLDIGFGTGGFSLALALQKSVLTNLDISLYRINLMHDNIGLYKVNNIHPLCASAVTLPYKENTFDLIILNGVLEYTAIGQKGDPRKTHINVLKYVRNLLRPRGLFYLGIENRYYLKYLLGYKPHKEMRFSNVLPRSLSKYLSKKLMKSEFRKYIYSYNEYLNLLKEAGFNDLEFFTALPNYKFPEYIIPIEEVDSIKDKIMKINTKKLYKYVGYALAHSNYLYKKIGPDFIILSKV